MDGAVVLRDVEVDGPGTQRPGHLSICLVELLTVLPVVIVGQDAVLGRVVAHREEQVVRHVGLVTERLGPADHLQQLHHARPAVHPAPANLAFGRQPFAVCLRNVAGSPKCVGNPLGIAVGILGPVSRARRGIDTDDSVLPDAEIPQPLADDTRLAHLIEEALALLLPSDRCTTASRWPHRRNQRADHEAARRHRIAQPLQIVERRVDARVRLEEKQVDSVEPGAVYIRGRGEIQHRLEADERLGPRAALADQPWPHRVMQRRVCMLRHGSHHLPSVSLRPQRAQGLVVRIAGTEVLEDDERIAGARDSRSPHPPSPRQR